MIGLLILAAFCLGMGGYALGTGTLIMRGKYEREYQPGMFWFGTLFYLGMGVFVLLMALVKKLQS